MKYLIIGNSAGGIAAAEAIRRIEPRSPITVVSEEPYPAYSRPAIAEYLMGERDFDDRMMIRDAEFYTRNSFDTRFGVKVTKLDLEKRQAILQDGHKLTWDKLLIATGGSPIVPKMEGLGLEGIHSFVTIEDARKLLKAIEAGAKTIVVIGGGLIGCSLTHALLRRGGVEVVLVELKDHVLTTMMDGTGSKVVEEKLKALGVKLFLGRSVTRILPAAGATKVGAVVLDNDEQITCDAVGMAVGVTPRTELAKGTTIKVNRGIVVDKHMETSAPGVYACGDVAEAYDFILGANRVVAIWPNAYIGGLIAGANMAGVPDEYDGCTAMNAFSYFGMALASAGMFEPDPKEKCEVMTSQDSKTYKKVVLKDNRIVGFILMGKIEQAGVLYHLMRDKADVSQFQKSLTAANFGIVSLPREMRDKWLGAGNGRAPAPISAEGARS